LVHLEETDLTDQQDLKESQVQLEDPEVNKDPEVKQDQEEKEENKALKDQLDHKEKEVQKVQLDQGEWTVLVVLKVEWVLMVLLVQLVTLVQEEIVGKLDLMEGLQDLLVLLVRLDTKVFKDLREKKETLDLRVLEEIWDLLEIQVRKGNVVILELYQMILALTELN
jgi:hypothetical protein